MKFRKMRLSATASAVCALPKLKATFSILDEIGISFPILSVGVAVLTVCCATGESLQVFFGCHFTLLHHPPTFHPLPDCFVEDTH